MSALEEIMEMDKRRKKQEKGRHNQIQEFTLSVVPIILYIYILKNIMEIKWKGKREKETG